MPGITYDWICEEIEETRQKSPSRNSVYDLAALLMLRDHMHGESTYTLPDDADREAPVDPAPEHMVFDQHMAEAWVTGMQNADPALPHGAKWTPEALKPLAQKYGIPTDGERFWAFWAVTNAMYSDYGEVAKKFGVVSPEFYAHMAKAWLEDKDANPGKAALYYKYVVKK